ncbi:MAG: bifunctional hydroxymethylpyrimidine kinase/phosphomethylpyrimidine kinase [Sulfurimonas sp.]|nr:bifunctional hydroxymethylpyrimidine kinase/phosphomethylpyrimidine kinase [Sulfurimonas sp.]MDD5203011.1 bifunctional hydroxymethylpyrimidine kinase/phosphomethylpyrimidine kinase [Sulfurimonas sp.]
MKVVLTIAGSDSSGGAGIQADLKTFEAFGLFGTSAITVLTAQNTQGVRSIAPLGAAFIKEQIAAVLDDFDVAAIKIGVLYSKEIIEAVREIISTLDIPIVLDPVFISKVGSPLLEDGAIEAMKTLFAHVSLITPNMYEAHALFGYKHGDTASLEQLHHTPCPVLIKHQILEMPHQKVSVDQLFYKHQKRIFQSPMIETTNLHGTGCSYSSAIAANLALGHSLEKSIEISKAFIYQAILHAPNIGHGAGPINHKAGVISAY